MSTKTIAVDSRVYERLARLKGRSESFSKLLDRLAREVSTAHTGAGILAQLGHAPPPLDDEEARLMLAVSEGNRRTETWPLHDLS
ncbi:MAG: antitoxin VapB family protein [Deltaproteobacteria bacterium]|nr:antitoxin VapB family protein [Deltaproteobacteria bacterium]